MRCDANVSIRRRGEDRLGTRTELKNINSFRFVQNAVEHEIARQIRIVEDGGRIVQETRLWNEEKGETRTLRSKEEAADYRYFPEPDLPPLVLEPAFVAAQRAAMGELPGPRRERFAREYGLPDYDVQALTQEAATGDWFEALARACGDAKAASNWMMSEVLPASKQRGSLAQFGITPERLADLIAAVAAGTVNSTAARKVFARMRETGEDAKTSIAAMGLERLADPTALEPLVRAAIDALPQAAADVKRGKQKAADALKGHVMRQSRGKADPAVVEEILARLLRG
jgi:aspartyl-tRNA(Asn)/glutamyl-tRNA(Gln) amidotransferase subunit B